MNSQTKPTPTAATKKAAPMDPEMRRYMLELEIKKKEEEKKKKAAEERKRKEEEKKQKIAEEKRKKEELAAQAKEPKSGPGSRGSLSQASKGAENKSSLSNLDENETQKREVKTLENLKPQSGGSFSAGSEGYLREEPVRKGEEETMEARASRIRADILKANHRDVRASNGNLESQREENYDEEFEIKTPQRDAWELKKSIAEKQQKIEEVRRSVYEQQGQQSKGIREDLPSYKIEEAGDNLGGSRSNFKAQNLVGGSFHDHKSQQNNVDVALNSKGFQRKPLQKVVEPEDLRNLQQTVGAVAVAVDNNLGKIRQNNGAVREPIAEKTRQQMEIAMQAKRFMMEQQKAKKKNEEAAIEKKKQILNQLYNKNSTPRVSSASTYHEERATPVGNRHDEYIPEPVNHGAGVEEQGQEEEQQFKFEDSIRKSKIQGQIFGVEEHDQQNRFENSIRNSRVQGGPGPAEREFEGSIRNSRAHMEPVEHNQQQHRFEDSIRNSRVQEQKKPVEEQWESPREPEEEEDDNKGQWEDGHDENEEEPEEEPYENDEEEEEEDQYQEDEQEEEENDEQEQEQPFSDRDNGRVGHHQGNQRQYYDDPSGLAELDRRDDWNRYPQQRKEETRQSTAQKSAQKSEWGYSRGDYEEEENEDDNQKSMMSTPYKEEFRQTPQSSAHQNQNEWSYDEVRQSTQSNNKKVQNQHKQPEEDHEKSYEEPQLSYAQMHARDKKKAQENEAHPSFGRNNQPPVHYDPFEHHQVDPNMATFGKKYVNDHDYSDDDYEHGQQHNQWGYKEEPKRPAYSVDKKPQGGQKNTHQTSYKEEENEDDYEQDEPQNQWGYRAEPKQPIHSNPMGQSIDKKSVRASHQSHQSENDNFSKIREAFNDNKKQSISMEPEKPAARGTRKWDLKRDIEAEDMTPTEKLSKGDEDYNTASFGDKLPRIRKQWGAQEKPESLTTSVKDLDQQPRRKTEENDEEEMLRSYRQNQVQKEKKEEVKEEVVTPPAKPEKQVLIVFGDDGEDEVLKQRKQDQFEKMKRRMEQRQKDKEEKKERDRSFVRENAKEKEKERATPDIIANYSDNEDAVPSSKKPQNKFTRQSTVEKPPEKLPRIPSAKPNIPRNQSANVATRPPIDKEREQLEELHSVGPSAKSTKSIAKSPGGPNNIFQKERTPSAIGGKKGVIEFSKQSNRPLIKNAITNVCLAGEPNRKEREEVVTKLNEVTGDVNFIIVFKQGRQDFRALYAYDTNAEEIRKVYSKGNTPDVLDANLVENYYRYNSGAKEFKHIQGNRNFSRAVDAVSLHPYLFKKATADKLY